MAAATPTGEVRLKRRAGLAPDRHRRRRASMPSPRATAAAIASASTCVRPACCSRRSAIARCSAAARARSTSRRRCARGRRARRSPRPATAGSTAALAVVGRTSWHAQRGADGDQGRMAAAAGGRARHARDHGASRSERARRRATRDGGFALPQPRRRSPAPTPAAARHVEQALPRALPRARGDGADQLHCARRRRQGRGVGADAGAGSRARRSPPRVAGVAEDAVTVHVTYLGGGFGRRLDVDFVGQAVRIARRDRRPTGAAASGRARRT